MNEVLRHELVMQLDQTKRGEGAICILVPASGKVLKPLKLLIKDLYTCTHGKEKHNEITYRPDTAALQLQPFLPGSLPFRSLSLSLFLTSSSSSNSFLSVRLLGYTLPQAPFSPSLLIGQR